MYWLQKLLFATIVQVKYKIYKIYSASIIAFMLVDIFCCFRTVFVNQTVVYICKNFQAVVAWSSTLLVLIFFFFETPPPPHSLSTVPIIFKKKNGLTICYRIAQFSAYAYIHIDNISKSRLSNLVQCMCVRKWLEYRLPFGDLRVNAYSYWQSLGFVVWEGNLNAVLVARAVQSGHYHCAVFFFFTEYSTLYTMQACIKLYSLVVMEAST